MPYPSWEDVIENAVENYTSSPKNDEDAAIEDVIHHKLRGKIAHSGPLNAYFEMRRREDSYELWTHEYVFGLAK